MYILDNFQVMFLMLIAISNNLSIWEQSLSECEKSAQNLVTTFYKSVDHTRNILSKLHTFFSCLSGILFFIKENNVAYFLRSSMLEWTNKNDVILTA